MATRCAFRDGQRRCSRNGFGTPALCRTHAVQTRLDDMDADVPGDSPLMGLLDLADRAFSKTNSDFARQVGNMFGEFLSQGANSSSTRQVNNEPPPRDREPAPPLEQEEDPRRVLMFEPGEQLTAPRIKARKRELAKLCHPDREGGSLSAMKRINKAADSLLCSL